VRGTRQRGLRTGDVLWHSHASRRQWASPLVSVAGEFSGIFPIASNMQGDDFFLSFISFTWASSYGKRRRDRDSSRRRDLGLKGLERRIMQVGVVFRNAGTSTAIYVRLERSEKVHVRSCLARPIRRKAGPTIHLLLSVGVRSGRRLAKLRKHLGSLPRHSNKPDRPSNHRPPPPSTTKSTTKSTTTTTTADRPVTVPSTTHCLTTTARQHFFTKHSTPTQNCVLLTTFRGLRLSWTGDTVPSIPLSPVHTVISQHAPAPAWRR